MCYVNVVTSNIYQRLTYILQFTVYMLNYRLMCISALNVCNHTWPLRLSSITWNVRNALSVPHASLFWLSGLSQHCQKNHQNLLKRCLCFYPCSTNTCGRVCVCVTYKMSDVYNTYHTNPWNLLSKIHKLKM